jgi:hypothetical protein
MAEANILLELLEVIKRERPVNVGFQHTDYAKHLFGIALRFKDKLYREDVGRFHETLFMEAEDYRKSFMPQINHNTWDATMKELKTLLDPGRFHSRHERTT